MLPVAMWLVTQSCTVELFIIYMCIYSLTSYKYFTAALFMCFLCRSKTFGSLVQYYSCVCTGWHNCIHMPGSNIVCVANWCVSCVWCRRRLRRCARNFWRRDRRYTRKTLRSQNSGRRSISSNVSCSRRSNTIFSLLFRYPSVRCSDL